MIQELLNKSSNQQQTVNARPFFYRQSFWKKVFKYLKVLLILALLGIALYGVFQQFFDAFVRTYPSPGSGFEICGNNEGDCFNNHVVINGNHEISWNYIVSFGQALRLGPFYAFFVWPIAQLEIAILTGISTAGWGVILSIFFLVLIIRSFVILLTFNQIKQQFKMQILQTKIAEIRGKYADSKKDQLQRQRMQLELMKFYRKNNVRPIGSIVGSIATLPFFYAIYRVVSALRYIKESSLGPFSMSVSPISAILGGSFLYIFIAIMVISCQIVAFKLPAWLNKQKKQQKMMDAAARKQFKTTNLITTVMIIIFAVIAISVPTALCFYWAFSSLFTVGQNYALFLMKKHHSYLFVGRRKPDEMIAV